MRCGLCGVLAAASLCDACLDQFEPLEGQASLFHYKGLAGEAVRRLKFSRITPIGAALGSLLRQRYFADLDGLYDAIIPVPIHWSRRFSRGFNQSELLCEAFGESLVQPSWLKRARATRQQVGLSREDREKNLDGAFTARAIVRGKRLLLVDDVVTSGATYRACRDVLVAAGALDVGMLAVAGLPDFDPTM